MTEKESLVALTSFLDFGPIRLRALIKFFGSARLVWNAKEKDLVKLGLSPKLIQKFLLYRKNFNFSDLLRQLKKHSIFVITTEDKNYPENLKGIDDSPLVLYVRGNLKAGDRIAVAIVGSRTMSSYGREVTEMISSRLAGLGITIVSGLAFGVDAVAHQSALDNGGRCIAVLAGGLDEITPKANSWLGEKILDSGGALISEFPPKVKPQKHFFPFRNRIISGLSKAVVVVEGRIKSGTIHTANHAAQQGRTVFAVPGQVTSPLAQAPNFLIQNGAKLVSKVEDILEELDWDFKVNREEFEKVLPSDREELEILDLLADNPLHLDEIARVSKLDSNVVFSKITILELKGLVKNIGNDIYKRV